jgi:hypothetical protein
MRNVILHKFCLFLFGFMAYQRNLDHNYGAESGKVILANLECYKL